MANIFDIAANRWRALTTNDLPGTGGGTGGGGDASAANQTTQISLETAIRDRLGATDEGVAATDTSSSGLNGLVKRLLQRMTTLIGLFPTLALGRTIMLSAATTVTTGAAVADNGRPPSFSANVSGTGSVSATVRIEGRNTANGVWFTLATITLSGTTSAADGFGSLVRYMEYRAVLAAVSGSGAAVTITMGS